MLEIHSLLKRRKRVVERPEQIANYFFVWKKLAGEFGVKQCDVDSFISGFIVGTNPELQRQISILAKQIKREEGTDRDYFVK